MKNLYVEITNICNLSCEFCPGHTRLPRSMSPEEFETVAKKIQGKAENLFLHVMGEPLLHPRLGEIINIADSVGAKLKLTTNGTLIKQKLPILLGSKTLHTVSISLHSFGWNSDDNEDREKFDNYFKNCFSAASELALAGKYVVFRLWNLEDGINESEKAINSAVLKELEAYFPPTKEEWTDTHRGKRIATHVFLEWGEKFNWPDIEKNSEKIIPDSKKESGRENCYALRAQAAVLADGTVVPCCLDRNGDIPLGNIFENELEDILSAPRTAKMKEAMEQHRFIEPLCRTCGFKRK